jgi:pimeloyl-ACP methyl ester carboxylesterase
MSHPIEHEVVLADATVVVRERGDGVPVVVLHSDIGSFGWSEFCELLSVNSRVFAIDLPGFGKSTRLEWARHTRDIAGIVLATIRQLGLNQPALVGTGYGGWVAAEMAAFAPSEIRHLFLVGSAGLKPDDGFILDQIMHAPQEYAALGFADEKRFTELFGETQEDFRSSWDEARETIARVAWKPYMYSYELPHVLQHARVPSTIVWGSDDRVVPLECAHRFKEVLSDSELRVIDGAGHWLDLECPGKLSEIVTTALQPQLANR